VSSLSSADVAAGTESLVGVALSGADDGSSSETEEKEDDVHVGSDNGASTECQGTSAQLAHTDSADSLEENFLEVDLSGSDSASGMETQTVRVLGADAGSSAEDVTDITDMRIGADQVSVSESYSIAVQLHGADSLHGTDTHRPFPAGPVEIGDYEVSLVMGPATVYVADFDSPEPLDSEIHSVPSALYWKDIGTTLDGVTLTVTHEFDNPDVTQIPLKTASRLKRRHLKVEMNMAEMTLINLLYALNSGSVEVGSGYQGYSPPFLDRATPLTYRAIIVDGWAPGFSEIDGKHRRRRIVLRKCLSTEDVNSSYTKDKLTVQNVTWTVHRVDDEVSPFKVIDEE
jgi:hypothetical protein